MDIFPRTFGEGLEARLTGPGKGRFVMQPLMAIALGIRDGIADAKHGAPPYFIRLAFTSQRKMYVLKTGLKQIAAPLSVGIVLDMILQWVMFQAILLLPALMAGTLLVAIPYVLARGVSNRLARRWYYDRKAVHEEARQAAVGR